MNATWVQRKLWDFSVGVVLIATVALAWRWIDGAQWIELAKWFGGLIAATVGIPATATAVTAAVAKAKAAPP